MNIDERVRGLAHSALDDLTQKLFFGICLSPEAIRALGALGRLMGDVFLIIADRHGCLADGRSRALEPPE